MKRKLLLLTLNMSLFIQAQTGEVGINTTSPTHTLDVNGTARIRNMDIKTILNPNEHLVIEDGAGVLNRITKANFNKNNVLELTGTAPGLYNQSDATTLYAGYIFDGSSNKDFILPPAVNGTTIYYYALGDGTAATYTFTGSATGVLAAPSRSVSPDASDSATPYRRFTNLGITYNLFSGSINSPSANWKLTLTQPDGSSSTSSQLRFRYTKLEFICIKNSWYFIHRNPR